MAIAEASMGTPKISRGPITSTHRHRCESRARGKLAKNGNQTIAASRQEAVAKHIGIASTAGK
jgi:hypothetical protein